MNNDTTQENIKPMNKHHDTNQTYDSCKDCEKLMKESLRLAKKINELHGINSALEYANSQISEHNKAIIKDLKETREQLRVANASVMERMAKRAINWLLLEQYLLSHNKLGVVHFKLSFQDKDNIYINPIGVDGSTIDFKLNSNHTPANKTIKP